MAEKQNGIETPLLTESDNGVIPNTDKDDGKRTNAKTEDKPDADEVCMDEQNIEKGDEDRMNAMTKDMLDADEACKIGGHERNTKKDDEDRMNAMTKDMLNADEACMNGGDEQHAGAPVIYCDPCSDEGDETIAEGFCVNCNDYLCKSCVAVHRKPRLWKYHVLYDSQSMPRSKPKPVVAVQEQNCSVHKEQPVMYYCKIHDNVLCGICKQMEHRRCGRVGEVLKLSTDLLDRQELEKVRSQLASLRQEFLHNSEVASQNGDNIRTSFDELIIELTKVKDSDIEMTNELRETCEKMAAAIGSVEEILVAFEQNDDTIQLLIALNQNKQWIDSLRAKLSLVMKDNKMFEYIFFPGGDTSFYGLIGSLHKNPKAIASIDIAIDSDVANSHVTGIEMLPNNRIIVADHANGKVKLVDITTKTTISELQLGIRPWDLTNIGGENIAVTADDREQILIVHVSANKALLVRNTLIKQKRVVKSKKTNGIVFYNNHLAVCNSNVEIQILDLKGTLVNTIHRMNKDGVELFGAIQYIALGPDEQTFYLSDYQNNKVLIIDVGGKVISSFQHEHLNNPKGIAVGRNGRVFVCSHGTNSILELTSDLSECEVILEAVDGMESPCSILYNESECSLLIGDALGELKVFLV